MKRFTFTIIALMLVAIGANAMSLNRAREEARFLTDKMYYELEMTDAQYNSVFEINFDYFYDLNSPHDAYGYLWDRRNEDLSYVLDSWQFQHLAAIDYFYRPVSWVANAWNFLVYRHYRNDMFYYGLSANYHSYMGGHSWRRNGGRSYFGMHRPRIMEIHHSAAPRRPEAGHSPVVGRRGGNAVPNRGGFAPANRNNGGINHNRGGIAPANNRINGNMNQNRNRVAPANVRINQNDNRNNNNVSRSNNNGGNRDRNDRGGNRGGDNHGGGRR